MKLRNIITFSLALLTGITSCNVLDTEPFTTYDEATVWGSKSTADAFVLGTVNGWLCEWKSNNVGRTNQ